MQAKVFESITRRAPMGFVMKIDTGERAINTVKDGAVDDYVATPYRSSPQAESFIPSIFDERLKEFLDTKDLSSLGKGWMKSQEYGVAAEAGSREDGTYQAIWVARDMNKDLVAISTVADGISHTARFEHVAPFHHDEADEWSVTTGRLKPLGFQKDSLEESVSFQAEIGRQMLFQGDKYEVTEFGLQEVFPED